MNQQYKVSIIIPVYNTENYIEKCLISIINQTYKNIEIVIIDDGSTDNSSIICKNFAKKDKRVIYKKIKNGGVSNARNTGISISTGDYIVFVDSDDYIGNKYIGNLISTAVKNNCQIVVCGITEVDKDKFNEISIYKNSNDYLCDITYPKKITDYLNTFEFNSSCCQLFSKKLIDDNNIRFNSNIKYGEDMLFSLESYVNSKKTMYIKQYDYFYMRNDNSAMGQKNINSIYKFYDDNYNSTIIINNKFNFNSIQKKILVIKTISVFNGISTTVINNYKFNDCRKIILKQRKKYSKLFKDIDFKLVEKKKDKFIYFLLKYKLIITYIIIKKFYKK